MIIHDERGDDNPESLIFLSVNVSIYDANTRRVSFFLDQ